VSPAVVNASPLIVLARAGLLDVLPGVFASVVTPAAVRAEIAAGPADDPARLLLPACVWLREAAIQPPLPPLAVWQLGAGESEVLEFARLHPGTTAVVDDRAARRAAETLGVPVCGTLGVLALATRGGLVPSFPAAIEAVRRAGLYLDEGVVTTVARALETR
jgi:predicted nucleic acid-binding protein